MFDDPKKSASLVIEHIVPQGKGLAFRWWHANLTRSAQRFEGYIRTDLCSPVKTDHEMKWYSITHFKSPDDLSRWLKSTEREKLIDSGSRVFKSYQFTSFNTGLEGWFSHQTGSEQMGLGPPAWKQNIAVILGLYPVVMLQSFLFAALGLMQDWPLPVSMIVNNLITSSILTWIVMPQVSRLLSFWLQPAPLPLPIKQNLVGVVGITVALGAMVYAFGLF